MLLEAGQTCELTVQRISTGYGFKKQVSAEDMRGIRFSGPVSRRLEEEVEDGAKDDAYGVQATTATASF